MAGLLYAASVGVRRLAALPWYLPLVGVFLAPIAAHYKWLHRGYRLGTNHLVTRNGVWNRETKRVPYHRLQTVIDSRTLFQRRWRVATVIGDTAGSLSVLGDDAAAVDVEVDDAVTLRSELRDRLRASLADRRRQRTDGSAATRDTGATGDDTSGEGSVETTAETERSTADTKQDDTRR